MSRPRNITKIRRRPDFNIGFVIFLVIFIYIAASIIIYFTSDQTTIYEVTAGTLAYDNTYTGFIIRNEKNVTSEYAGNINYYVQSGYKLSENTLCYSIDETGNVFNAINDMSGQIISDDNIATIKQQLNNYTISYSGMKFNEIYDVRQDIDGIINRVQTDNIIDTLDTLIEENNAENLFHKVFPNESGLISFSTDNYVGITEDDIKAEVFNTDKFEYENLLANTLAAAKDVVYKLVTDDTWYIYIPLNESEAAELSESKSIAISFVNTDISCTAGFDIITADNEQYGKITLSKYMINFIDDRFVQIELTESAASGLKIPVSSVFSKSFYTIPKEYMTESNTFIRRYYNSNGEISMESISATIYEEDDTYCYVSMDDFNNGDILMLADSDETYVVGTMGELSGVYCINRGYAVFRKVEIIDRNSEYYIVRRGTSYGLSIYDHIVLDYTTIKENELIS